MSSEAALKALSNSELASGAQIPASKHRNVNDAIIEELFDAQSRGDVLAAVQSAVSAVGGDVALIIRSGQAYLIPLTEIGGITELVNLDDVSISSPLNDQIIVWDSASSKFVVKNIADISGGNITGGGTANAIPKFTSGT